MTRFSDLSSHYRLYGAGADPHWVARDLRQHFTPYALVREQRDEDLGWHVLDVDDDLLRILARTKVTSLGDVLPHLQQTTNHFGRRFSSKAISSALRGPRKPGSTAFEASIAKAIAGVPAHAVPHVITDAVGTAMAMSTEAAAPEQAASIYPHLDGPKEIEPDTIAEFSLHLDSLPLEGSGTMLPLTFPEGADSLTINARVSTAEFSMPTGETWRTEFNVDRDLKVTPDVWPIKARALDDRKQFTLAVIFNAAGTPLGSVTQTLLRKGTASPDVSPKQSANTLVLPAIFGGRYCSRTGAAACGLYGFRLRKRPPRLRTCFLGGHGAGFFRGLTGRNYRRSAQRSRRRYLHRDG